MQEVLGEREIEETWNRVVAETTEARVNSSDQQATVLVYAYSVQLSYSCHPVGIAGTWSLSGLISAEVRAIVSQQTLWYK